MFKFLYSLDTKTPRKSNIHFPIAFPRRRRTFFFLPPHSLLQRFIYFCSRYAPGVIPVYFLKQTAKYWALL